MIPDKKPISKFSAIKIAYPKAVSHTVRHETNEEIVKDSDGNLIVIDDALVQVELDKLRIELDKIEYARNRAPAYPRLAEQFDLLWHAIDADTLDKTSDFYTTLKAVKDAHPKG